ncbi:unnamed protein product [Paramecium pentaurelia]|uniref:cystathionine beta-synthase n=1 Tax=Paramecium pentaurelia TaxID=43138 RepID=A0A8S1TNC4_9CILI|nr:unnamed protein product [Paramecium pentaurelia]
MIQDLSKDTIQCTYKRGANEQPPTPHSKIEFVPFKKIYNDALDAVGHTPMIRLNKIPKEYGLKCEVLVKCEFLNVGGSLKDRIGVRMVLDAEKQGRLGPGKSLVEATSGNTGVGLALACAVRGYPLVITMPEKMSQEKQDVLTGLGAKVIRTPTEAAWYEPESLIQVAKKMATDDPNVILLDQYSNPSNPLAHYEGTAEEILWACDDKLDAVIISTGTGGTITGVGRKIHERVPGCKVIAVDPYGSDLALPQEVNKTDIKTYKVEGIGYDFIPKVLDRTEIDGWVKTVDYDSLLMARKLLSQEGLLCGGSSGATVWGALEWAKSQNFTENQRIVIILPDNIRNYITKHLSKTWMIENKFIPYDELKETGHPLAGRPITDLNLHDIQSLDVTTATIGQCLEILKTQPAVPLQENGKLLSVVFEKKILAGIVNKKLNHADLAKKVHSKEFVLVPNTLDLNQLERIVERHDVVFVEDGDKLKYVTPRDLLGLFA